MKRILIIDESEIVRETLALILGREFAVSKRTLGAQGLSFADCQDAVDLLILGVSPQHGLEAASLTRFASQLPFAVLFLVDSKATARGISQEPQVDCLAKPFNPYELHEKVGQLLARRSSALGPRPQSRDYRGVSRYLEFPYLSRSAATLVKRFASARLPLLVSGEIGCGQDRIVEGICQLQKNPGVKLAINAAEANSEYLEEKKFHFSFHERLRAAPTTVIVQDLEKSSPAAQSLLLGFLQEAEEKLDEIHCLATATGDLLEKVYRGEFLEALYYKLATLTLKLQPVRERRDDIPVLADWFARSYADVLRISEPTFSAEASSRLCNYLWFGNLMELETVIARTLALRRKSSIEAVDLVFDFGDEAAHMADLADLTEFTPGDATADLKPAQPSLQPYGVVGDTNGSTNRHVNPVDLNVVIHELAHEFKNPMVTIKTFAQLLGDRYQDENFRTRFQEVVGSDIERMDELLEVMIEFADFAQPRKSTVALEEKLRNALSEIQPDCTKRQTRIEWKQNGVAQLVRADEAQLEYILKNVLLAALSQARMGSEIEIDLSSGGALVISYVREGGRVASIAHYLDEKSRPQESLLPLRVILAKHLLETNGGHFAAAPLDSDRETLRMEFPVVEDGQQR
jgi:DNA-binding NtrC family response regulator